MFNPINLIFHRQTAVAADETPASAELIVREDFTLFNVDSMTVTQILDILRRDTIEFVEDNRLTWGVSDFVVQSVPVRVKLTENWDVVYSVNGETTFNKQHAAELIKSQSVQF